MQLIVTSRSLQHVKRAKQGPLSPIEMPDFVAGELGLKGLSFHSGALRGLSITQLEAIRDRADRARCPVLLITQDDALDFVADPPAAIDRVTKLGLAASKIGAPAGAVEVADVPADMAERAAANVKRALVAIERFDAHLLLRPGEGFLSDAQRIADFIKRIGGFRIGSMPSFERAAASGDVLAALRKLAPYAQALEASVKSLPKSGAHTAWPLAECLDAVIGVGYENPVAIDYLGKVDPVGAIERARDIFLGLIDAEEPV